MSDVTRRYEREAHPDLGFFHVKQTPSSEEITRFYAEEFYSTKYKAFTNSALTVKEADREFHDAHRQDILDTIERLSGRPVAGQKIRLTQATGGRLSKCRYMERSYTMTSQTPVRCGDAVK